MYTVAVDVDLTVVDTLTPWMRWLSFYTDEKIKNEQNSYNLEPEMREILTRAGFPHVDPLEYWRQPNLYDRLEPIPGAVDNLKKLNGQGDIIVFVSTCFPEHISSKEQFVKKHFPFAEGFLATHEKHFVAYDALIDDKIHHHRMGRLYRPTAYHILFTGIREDGSELDRMYCDKMNDWDNLHRMIRPTRQVRYGEPAFAS